MVTQHCNSVDVVSTQVVNSNQLVLETTDSSIAVGLILLVVGLVPHVGCRINIIMYLDVSYVIKQSGHCDEVRGQMN